MDTADRLEGGHLETGGTCFKVSNYDSSLLLLEYMLEQLPGESLV